MDKEEAGRLFNEADQLYQADEYAQALDVLDRLDAAYPDNRRVMYPRAKCLAAVGRTAEALDLCDRLVNEHGYQKGADLKCLIQERTSEAAEIQVPGMEEDMSLEDLNAANIDDEPSAFTQAPPPVSSGSGRGVLVPVLLLVAVAVIAAAGGGVYVLREQSAGEQAARATAPDSGDDAPPGVAAASASPQSGSAAASLEIDHSGPPELVKVQGGASEGGVNVNVSVEYGVWTDCGSYDCFLEKYRACEPAAIRMQTMGSFIVEYEILGAQAGECQIEMTVVNMPPYPTWQGKSMACPCDNSVDFIKLTEQIGPGGIMNGTVQCDGPLFDAMEATLKQYQQ